MNEILIVFSLGVIFGIGYWYGYYAGIQRERTRFYRERYAKDYGDGT